MRGHIRRLIKARPAASSTYGATRRDLESGKSCEIYIVNLLHLEKAL